MTISLQLRLEAQQNLQKGKAASSQTWQTSQGYPQKAAFKLNSDPHVCTSGHVPVPWVVIQAIRTSCHLSSEANVLPENPVLKHLLNQGTSGQVALCQPHMS